MDIIEISEISYKKLIVIIFSIASLYQLGYWSTFNINAIAFMSFQEIVTSFFYPFIFGFLTNVIWFIININTLFAYRPFHFKSLPLAKRILSIIAQIGLLSVFISMLFLDTSSLSIILVPLLIWALYSKNLIEFLINHNLIQIKNNIITTIQFIGLIIILSFCIGKANGFEIKKNLIFDYTQIDNKYFKILGKGGTYFILESLDYNENVIFETEKIAPISIYHFNRNKIVSPQDKLVLYEIIKK